MILLPVFVVSIECCELKNCATNFRKSPVGVEIKSCDYLPRIARDMHEMEHFVLFLDPEPCNC